MPTIEELLKQKEQLEAQIEQALGAERAKALEQARSLIAMHGLSSEELFGRGKRGPRAGKKVEPKFRDPASGQTWSGRGRPPAWLRGKSKADFKIA